MGTPAMRRSVALEDALRVCVVRVGDGVVGVRSVVVLPLVALLLLALIRVAGCGPPS